MPVASRASSPAPRKERHMKVCLSFFGAAILLRKIGRLRAGDRTREGEPVKGSPLTLPLPCGGRECRQQNLWAVTKRNTIRQDGVSQRVDKPTPLSFRGAKRRGNPYLFRQKPAKSAEFVRFRNGLPRQCAHWLAMTGFFDSLRNTIRQDGVSFWSGRFCCAEHKK